MWFKLYIDILKPYKLYIDIFIRFFFEKNRKYLLFFDYLNQNLCLTD